MGDRLDDEPNIPLFTKKISTSQVTRETESEEGLRVHTAPNIPWVHTGSKSVHSDRPQTQNDLSISDRGSVSLRQPSKVESENVSTGETVPKNNITDPGVPMIENSISFDNPFTSTQHRLEPNIPHTRASVSSVPTSQRNFPEQNVRQEKDVARVLSSDVLEANPSSKSDTECDNVELGNSNSKGHVRLQNSFDIGDPTVSEEPTWGVSDHDDAPDIQSKSIVCSEVDLQTLLQSFQDVFQQANDLQRRNETFLHSIRQDERTSCEDLERRMTETEDNLTRLEDRIKDGDSEIRLLEETVGHVVHNIDDLCKSFEKQSSEQIAITFRGDDNNVTRHRGRDKTTKETKQQNSTNQKCQHKMTSQEEGHNILDAEGERQRVAQSHRRDDRYQRKSGPDSRRHRGKHKDREYPSKLDTPIDTSEHREESNIRPRSGTECATEDTMKLDLHTEVGNTKPATGSSSETISNIATSTNKMPNSKLDTDVSGQNGDSPCGVPEISESKTKLEPLVGGVEKLTRSRSKRRKLKCSELGFKYRNTNDRVDNRLKVIRHEVVLRGGAPSDLMDSNVMLDGARQKTTTNLDGAKHASHSSFFDASGHLEDAFNFDMPPDMPAMAMDAFHMTEADIRTSNSWVAKANEERRRGASLAPYRGKGPDTVLLLDTSESMRGQPFQDMIRTAKQIIEGIQGVNMTIGVEENIGIVVFGQETTVLRHLTMDYGDLKSSLDTLRVGGPSPLAAGFVMGLAAQLGNASGFTSVKDVPLSPRIILISDGHATLDSSSTEEAADSSFMTSHIRLLLLPIVKDYAKRGNRVFCIPVGNAPQTVYFEDICRETKGRIYMTSEVHRLVKMTQAEVSAIEVFEGLKGNNRKQMLEILTASSMHMSSVQQDAEDIVDYIEYLNDRQASPLGFELPMHIEQDPSMPPIGTRVRRGPAWKWNNQDTEGPGTVIGHQKNGMIWIEWDNGFKNRYHYQPDAYDVKVVDEPRQVLGDQLIAAGYLVKRGTDWTYADQDGGQGNVGTVFLVRENGMVGVRWQNGRMDFYKYGAEGRFDIEICDPNTTPRPPVHSDRAGSPNVQNVRIHSTNENLPRSTVRNDPPHEIVKSDPNFSRKMESYLPSVEEMNRKNTSSLPSTPVLSEERSRDSGGDDVKFSLKPDPVGTDYRVKWQYVNSKGQFHDYPGNVNGKIEATYIKRPGGTAIINMDGVGYRILFTKMVQVEMNTKATVNIRRTVLA